MQQLFSESLPFGDSFAQQRGFVQVAIQQRSEAQLGHPNSNRATTKTVTALLFHQTPILLSFVRHSSLISSCCQSKTSKCNSLTNHLVVFLAWNASIEFPHIVTHIQPLIGCTTQPEPDVYSKFLFCLFLRVKTVELMSGTATITAHIFEHSRNTDSAYSRLNPTKQYPAVQCSISQLLIKRYLNTKHRIKRYFLNQKRERETKREYSMPELKSPHFQA